MAATRGSIAHVTLQPVESDARVGRARAALEEAGFACPLVGPGFGFNLAPMTAIQKLRIALAYGLSGRFGDGAARAGFFTLPVHRQAVSTLIGMRPEAMHAHDWDGAIVADAAARRLGIPFAYDAHEYAAEMHAERRGWRLTVAPMIRALEGPTARRAAFVVAVSDRLARAMAENLPLLDTPITVRNFPDGPIPANAASRPIVLDRRIHLHYHGILARGRGIETILAALERLPDRFTLRLTGPWRQPAFEAEVRALLMTKPKLALRVVFVEALPPERLVAHAAEADVGLCLLAGATIHDKGALPNKLFEYLHAGLVIVASGSQEIADIVERTGCGVIVAPGDADALVATLTALDPRTIEKMRTAAIAAAGDSSGIVKKRNSSRLGKMFWNRSRHRGSFLNSP